MKEKRAKKRQADDSTFQHLKRLLRGLAHKGREPLTVMVAPHNEEKVLHFRVSLFALWVFGLAVAGLAAGVIVFSAGLAVASSKAAANDEKARNIQASLHDLGAGLESIGQLAGILEDLTNSINPNVEKDASLSAEAGDLSQTFGLEQNAQLQSPELTQANAIKAALQQSLPTIKSLKETFDNQRALLSDVPSRWPVINGTRGVSGYVSQLFGPSIDPFTGLWQFHTGVDIAFGRGTPIGAAANGTVSKVEYNAGGYGNYVIVRHKYGFYTLYGHMQRSMVQVGQQLKQGDIVGLMGSTGRSTGPHLHFEIMIGTEVIDPMTYLSIANPAFSRYVKGNN